ncbi:gem-associated protein 6 [Triplophysa rosa]|nr:gem-associated protein 6 [Triplophysa rosa]
MKWRDMNPLEWREFIHHEVCVTACDEQRFEGSVFTVDPVSASVVLVTFQETDRASVRVILGHAVKEVRILRSGSEETERRMKRLIVPDTTPSLCPEELQSRRENLRLWLERNRFPVTEDGQDLRVASVLTISAPYRPEDCSCTNEIILARVQSLVQNKQYAPTITDDIT